MTDDRYATVRYNQARRRVLGRRWWVDQDPETAAEQIAEYLGGLRRGEAWAAEALARARAQGGMGGTVELVLDRLTEAGCLPRRSGPSWSAKCPAHDDKSPSLSVSEGSDGRALVNCHAGCSARLGPGSPQVGAGRPFSRPRPNGGDQSPRPPTTTSTNRARWCSKSFAWKATSSSSGGPTARAGGYGS